LGRKPESAKVNARKTKKKKKKKKMMMMTRRRICRTLSTTFIYSVTKF